MTMDYLCAAHRVWEHLDDWVEGLCAWCCLPAPCPLGHDKGEGFDAPDQEIADAEWRERQERNRHKTGATKSRARQEEQDVIEIDYLDWS